MTSADTADPRALRGLATAAAGLTGFGLVLWIAANWDALGRSGQFSLLQAAVKRMPVPWRCVCMEREAWA